MTVPATVERQCAAKTRAPRHRSFDRVVFEFDHALPGARVQYGTVRTQGRGNELPLLGGAFLGVTFTGISTYDENGNPTFAQPKRMTPGFPTLTQVGLAGDFRRPRHLRPRAERAGRPPGLLPRQPAEAGDRPRPPGQ